MRWITSPKSGEVRIRLKFAWLPKTCTDGNTYWLEFIWIKERYIIDPYYTFWERLKNYGKDYPLPYRT